MGGDPFINLARLQEALQGQFPRPVALLPGLDCSCCSHAAHPARGQPPGGTHAFASLGLAARGSTARGPGKFGLWPQACPKTAPCAQVRVQRLKWQGCAAVATLLQGAGAALLQKCCKTPCSTPCAPRARTPAAPGRAGTAHHYVEEKGLRVRNQPCQPITPCRSLRTLTTVLQPRGYAPPCPDHRSMPGTAQRLVAGRLRC